MGKFKADLLVFFLYFSLLFFAFYSSSVLALKSSFFSASKCKKLTRRKLPTTSMGLQCPTVLKVDPKTLVIKGTSRHPSSAIVLEAKSSTLHPSTFPHLVPQRRHKRNNNVDVQKLKMMRQKQMMVLINFICKSY